MAGSFIGEPWKLQYTAEQLRAAAGKTPVPRDGYWYVWDIVTSQYVSSGVAAGGDMMKTVYDPDNDVADAGGISAYVQNALAEIVDANNIQY